LARRKLKLVFKNRLRQLLGATFKCKNEVKKVEMKFAFGDGLSKLLNAKRRST
jgi:hypothetical protein